MPIIAILISLLFLSGCIHAPTTEEIIVKETEYLSIPESFLSPCVLPAPPDKKAYLKADFNQRELMLTKLYLDALAVNEACNIRLKNALKYQREVIERYDKQKAHPHPG